MSSLLHSLSLPPPLCWEVVNGDHFQATLRYKVDKIKGGEVAELAYVNGGGRLQYAYSS